MIKVQPGENGVRVVLMPNRSLSWEGNKSVIWSMGFVCIGIAVGFTVLTGAWVILPFAGLEVAILGSTLYYVSWKLSYRHIITIDNDRVKIEKGVYHPRGRWEFPAQSTHMHISPPEHDWEAESLSIGHGGEEVEVGKFLGRDDMRALIDVLGEYLPR